MLIGIERDKVEFELFGRPFPGKGEAAALFRFAGERLRDGGSEIIADYLGGDDIAQSRDVISGDRYARSKCLDHHKTQCIGSAWKDGDIGTGYGPC